MGYNKSPKAFDDCIALAEQALLSDRGVKVTLPDNGTAVRLVARLNQMRTNDRKANSHIYPPDHEMHNASVYDMLVFARKDAVVMVEKRTINDLKVELL